MSAYYQRVKQADLALPAPLRWLTRAFSSITLAVTLLSLVVIYGLIASVPVAFLARGGMYALSALIGIGGTALAARVLWVRSTIPTWARVLSVLGILAAGLALTAVGCWGAVQWSSADPWFYANRATVIYRLPYFEMTEMEFYGWWPLQLILGLFVINLIWATIRRIEIKFANLGVLTVHTGIVTVAVGSIIYSRAKIEGDMFLVRRDLGGQPSNQFYDATTAAVYLTTGDADVAIPLPKLPRYNDYTDGKPRPLDIRLDNRPDFIRALGTHLHASIQAFISYGKLTPTWVDASTTTQSSLFDRPNPAIRLVSGDKADANGGFNQLLVAGVPAQRVVEAPGWAIEYLDTPDPQRINDLMAEFDGEQGLVVDIPSAGFRGVYSIAEGQTIKVGDTGYTIKVEAIGPYGMGFASRGYEGARDTRAMVQVIKTGPDARTFRRIIMHRYPERSQDFVPAPGDPKVGPMGKRTDPDPSVRLTYIDASKLQIRLISGLETSGAATRPGAGPEALRLMVRIPGHKPFLGLFPDNRFPLGTSGPGGEETWMHITQRIANAVQVTEPTITPHGQRNPKDEGTFLHALLPVDLQTDTPGPDGKPWHQRVWLAHLRYPDHPDDEHRPVDVDVPGIGMVRLTFSRERLFLPFAVQLDDFNMQPYPGTDIPRDFVAHLVIENTPEDPMGAGVAGIRGVLGPGLPGIPGLTIQTGESHLNNPLLYDGVKLSQTGWDPGEPSDPDNAVRGPTGRYLHQQRFTILGVGNNRGIHIIFFGACLIVLGIPWAFYIKPLLAQREKRRIQARLAAGWRPEKPVRPSDAKAPAGHPAAPIHKGT